MPEFYHIIIKNGSCIHIVQNSYNTIGIPEIFVEIYISVRYNFS